MDCNFKIEGELINLRTTRRSDLDDYERWNNPNLKAHQFDGPWYKRKGSPLSAVIKWRKRWLEGDRKPPYPFLEIETKDHIHIGWVVVYYHRDDPHKPEIGIDILEDSYWGRGIGAEALRLWIDYLFNERKFTRLGFTTWEGNKAIIRVGEKLGFIEEARIRKSCEVDGIFYDRISMGILRSEWKGK